MSLTNTGIFGRAQDAKTKTAEAETNQKATLDEYETELNKYGSDKDEKTTPIGDSTVNQVISTSENKEITDAKGNKIVVPAGFKIVKDGTNYENTANNEITVDKGIVVEDATGTATNGSQFVWIPVGTITKAEAQHHPQQNMLMKALGCNAFVEPDVMVKGFLKDDILIINSDGLTNLVSQEEIFREAKKDIEQAPKELVRIANENGGYDNITVIVIKNI